MALHGEVHAHYYWRTNREDGPLHPIIRQKMSLNRYEDICTVFEMVIQP